MAKAYSITKETKQVTAKLLESFGIAPRLVDDFAWTAEDTGISMNELLGHALACFDCSPNYFSPSASGFLIDGKRHRARMAQLERRKQKANAKKTAKARKTRTLLQRQISASLAVLDEDFSKYLSGK